MKNIGNYSQLANYLVFNVWQQIEGPPVTKHHVANIEALEIAL